MERTERYNYVFDQYDGDSFIYDLKEDKRIEDLSECANILNKKEKEIERWFEHKKFDAQVNMDCLDKIEELETRLSNCIVKPKFNVKDTIFVIVDDNIEEYFVDEILLRDKGTLWAYYDIDKATEITEKNEIFATEKEARKKLEEVKNE